MAREINSDLSNHMGAGGGSLGKAGGDRRIVDTLRMNDRELAKLVIEPRPPAARAADPSSAGAAAAAGAGSLQGVPIDPCLMTCLPRMLLRLQDRASGQWTTFLIKPCDIHENGLVFLHGAFVYKGAKCVLLARGADVRPVQIPASILHCTHLTGRVHQLVAVFDQPIRLEDHLFSDGASIVEALSRCIAPNRDSAAV